MGRKKSIFMRGPKPVGEPIRGETAESESSLSGTFGRGAGGELGHDAATAPGQFRHDLGQISIDPSAREGALPDSGTPLAPPLRSDMESRFGHDFSGVRIHTGGAAAPSHALAYTVGTDIVFAGGRFDPATTGGRQVLAHELAHVVQQSRGPAAADENLQVPAGHAALEAEADRAGQSVALGGISGAIQGSAAMGAVQMFDSYEHQEIGDQATKGEHGETKTVELAPDYRVTYGEMIALSGDYFGSIEEIRAIAAVGGKGAGTREEIDYIRRVQIPNISPDERKARTGEFSEEAVHAADARYYKLAAHNASHFANPEAGDTGKTTLEKANETHQEAEGSWDSGYFALKLKTVPSNAAGYYRQNHLKAIGAAVTAGKAGQSIDSAMAFNAFSDHFLTDSFSAGHNRTARTSISEYWNARQPMFFYNFKGYMAEKLAYYINDHETLIGLLSVDMINDQAAGTIDKKLEEKGMPDLQFGDLVSGVIHDYDNENGIQVTVDGADKTIFGDDNLEKGDTKDLVVAATQASVSDIEAGYDAGKTGQGYDQLYARIAPNGLFRGEELMPVVKPDSELAAEDRSIKWDYPDVAGLIADAKFREGLKIFLREKKGELAGVGEGLDKEYKREAFAKAIVEPMDGEQGIKMIWEILQWTPNTGGGIFGHNQDDNAVEYFKKARKTPGALESLMWSARANLIRNVLDGYTSGLESDAVMDLLMTCPGNSDVQRIIDFIGWERLEDKLGERFSAMYPQEQYAKQAA